MFGRSGDDFDKVSRPSGPDFTGAKTSCFGESAHTGEALVGAGASLSTTWLTQRTQRIRANTEWRLRERQALYEAFITEASRMSVDALVHSLEKPDQLIALYGSLGRIRLMSGDEVLRTTEEVCHRFVELYRGPNLSPDQILAEFEADKLDPLKVFSAACRTELLSLSSTA
jgi:hypothetical protein